MSQYFPKPYELFGGDINVRVDLSNYVTKADLKNATGFDTPKLAIKSDLVSLKAKVDKLDIEKIKPVPVEHFGTFFDKKKLFDKLAAKVNNIYTKGFVLKSKYDTD